MYSAKALLIILLAVLPFVVSQETPDSPGGTALPQTTTFLRANISGCTLEEQNAFLSTLPNAAVCIASLETISTPPLNYPHLLDVAFENLCTRDCGGTYVKFQESVCEDELAAESIRLFCTPSNGSAAVGDYCRFALADILDPSLLNSFDYCQNSTMEGHCPPRCKEALLNVKHEMGCCYQNVYNNTLCVNNSLLLSAGLITPQEFATLRALNDPAGNPWTQCGVEPPNRCGSPIFKPPAPPKCTDPSSFISFVPYPAVCGPALETVFNPCATNDSMKLASALKDVCSNDCGGIYANYLKTVCEDDFVSESLQIFCTLTDGSAAIGTHCRYAVGDVLDSKLFDTLFSCYNITPNSSCPSDCRDGLLSVKAQIGCCYQNIYNNTLYLTELFNAGLLTPNEFIGFEDLNNPAGNPWTLCKIEPPQKCERPPFTLPPTPLSQKCSFLDQRAYLLTLPNGVPCGNAIGIAFIQPVNNSNTLSMALDYLCTNECGGVYTNYLEGVCKDELGTESVKVFCTPTTGTAAIGPFCYYAADHLLYPSLLTTLMPCQNYSNKVPCSDECRDALLHIKSRIGCCYQAVYNNTMYSTILLDAEFITQYEFNRYKNLNNPAGNPWTRCEIEPPQKCEPVPFKPPAPPKCTLNDQIAFLSTLSNAAICGPSIATVFSPPANDSIALTHALINVCTNDCGGTYTDYLENVCNDKLGADSIKIFCAPTNSSAAVGNYCRHAVTDILGTSLFDALGVYCHNASILTPCVEDCRDALLRLKAQVGCCYQNIYNNTDYYTELLYAGLVTPREFTAFFDLNIPAVNLWTLCNVEPPQKCDSAPFKPPTPPKCTLEDQTAFISTLSDAEVCGSSIATVFSPPINDSATLTDALTNVCTNACGGAYINYLENVCDDILAAESLKIFCTPTNGSAAVGDYCRYAVYDILGKSPFYALFSCYNHTTDVPCAEDCRAALINLKAQIGCCYQNVHNNTRYYTQLLEAGSIAPHEFTGFYDLGIRVSNPWTFCDIEPPQMCDRTPFKPSLAPNCTAEDENEFLLSLPDGHNCDLSLRTVTHLNTNNSKALATAFDHACTHNCGGVYADYLENICNDHLAAENIRLYCTPTNGSATIGQFCRHATFDVLDPSLFRALATCGNNSAEGQLCTAECREGLLDLKANIGCCYQNVYNNTPYFVQLLNAGIITPSFFTQFILFNGPGSNPWIACMVEVPKPCSSEPFHTGVLLSQ